MKTEFFTPQVAVCLHQILSNPEYGVTEPNGTNLSQVWDRKPLVLLILILILIVIPCGRTIKSKIKIKIKIKSASPP